MALERWRGALHGLRQGVPGGAAADTYLILQGLLEQSKEMGIPLTDLVGQRVVALAEYLGSQLEE